MAMFDSTIFGHYIVAKSGRYSILVMVWIG